MEGRKVSVEICFRPQNTHLDTSSNFVAETMEDVSKDSHWGIWILSEINPLETPHGVGRETHGFPKR